jgi:hypothetical protein
MQGTQGCSGVGSNRSALVDFIRLLQSVTYFFFLVFCGTESQGTWRRHKSTLEPVPWFFTMTTRVGVLIYVSHELLLDLGVG